ncbi:MULTISPECIES: diacylglycerol kinase [unclassified Streptomyces]|uniref:diacylglycerol kinase n=1 Tax=Streptomycetaceae TaxID=2062 RepID=UPI002E77BC6B|nr:MULTISPECIES: diacylglycerol kinase [unclassified Streptomyces]MED7949819.1 diacylglycerol kinase [Streptomyces sp. BE303]MEE1828118.1 diacylglycerol kinase [Streptomyces sp. BE20]
MSSLSTPATGGPEPLLLLLDPAARQTDGESVRIAKDVLSGGADVKVACPESPSELDRVLSHRGRRRPVVIGSDLALQRVLQALHRQRELGADAVGMVPVGRADGLAAARALGVPGAPVAAARAVLAGAPRKLDLLVDDGGGVALGGVRIPGGGTRRPVGRSSGWRSLWAKLAAAEQGTVLTPEAGAESRGEQGARVRVEADGRLLADVHHPVRAVQVTLPSGEALGEGVMEIVVRTPGALVRVRAASVSVVGRGFGYEADGHPVGPVRARTWTVHPGCWGLLLPAA